MKHLSWSRHRAIKALKHFDDDELVNMLPSFSEVQNSHVIAQVLRHLAFFILKHYRIFNIAISNTGGDVTKRPLISIRNEFGRAEPLLMPEERLFYQLLGFSAMRNISAASS